MSRARVAATVFALGIIGTGLLAVPVLAGSAAYAVGEARRSPVGFGPRHAGDGCASLDLAQRNPETALHLRPIAAGNGDRAMGLGREGRPVVLVAEPQALPGMWLEDVLTDAGCAVSGPYGTCAEAAGSLDEAPPDFAVVSTDLNSGPGFPLACALRRKGIPFALIVGTAPVPRAFSDVPKFDRLFDARDVIAAVTARCPVRAIHRACPMAARIAAGEAVALDQCPDACRA